MHMHIHIHNGAKKVRTVDVAFQVASQRLATWLVSRVMDAGGIQAAGVACFDPTGAVLLLKRSALCNKHPGEWAFPAGRMEGREDARAAAMREMLEETGHTVVNPEPLGSYDSDGVHFTAFRGRTSRFTPRLNYEHTAFTWAKLNALPQPLHPGAARFLKPREFWDLGFTRARLPGVTTDEDMGHPFHGNQYVDGPGQAMDKPTSAKAATAKAAVHELLSSGHAFTFEELMKATGAKNAVSLTTAISDLKNPKYAGKAGPLEIVKLKSGHYQVQKTAAAPKEAPSPTAAPSAAPSTPSAPDTPAAGGVAKAPDVKMSKEYADKHYKDALHKLNVEAALAANDPKATISSAALKWKQGKAMAMAQWKANTTGVAQKPHPVEVFKEDIELMDDLELAHHKYKDQPTALPAAFDGAMDKWKSGTAAAKSKPKMPPTAPSDIQTSPQAKEPAKPVVPDVKIVNGQTPKGGPSLPVPDKLVPDGHKHIGHEDFVAQPGHSESPFISGLAHVHKALETGAGNAVANKKSVQQRLEEKLADSPHFQLMAAQYKKKAYSSYAGSLEAKLVGAWALSSGDHQCVSVAAQLAIRDVFKMDPAQTETKAFHYLQSNSEEKTHRDAAEKLDIDVSTPEKFASFKHGMQDFALAQYHATQEHLAQHGIKELYLVRGMKFGEGDAKAKEVKTKMQPASSFSTSHNTARYFSAGHSLFYVKVPASQVLSSYRSGYGCTDEAEVVVLNHPDMQMVKIGYKNAGSATSAAMHVKQTHFAGTKTATSSSAKTPTNFKFEPPKPHDDIAPGEGWTSNKHMKAALEAAHAGNVEGVDTALKGVPMNFGKTQKGIEDVKAALVEQLAKHAGTSPAATGLPKGLKLKLDEPGGLGLVQYKKKMYEAAKEGDVVAIQGHIDNLAGKNALITVKYGNDLIAAINEQVAAYKSKSLGTAVKAAPVTKADLAAHPNYSEDLYNMAKAKGYSNSEIKTKWDKHWNEWGAKQA